MKYFVGLILSAFVLQTLAAPAIEENEDASPAMPRNPIVEEFRTDIARELLRYQNFYDRSNAEMNQYRLAHVRLVTDVYNRLLTVFGEDIEAIRQSGHEVAGVLERRREVLGENNACLNGVISDSGINSARIGSIVQTCATYANTTLSTRLLNMFYPTFQGIVDSMAGVPLGVVNALGRGNVLQDEREIIEYLRTAYELKDIQWMQAVSQLLRWETNRFEVDGLFLVDEMTMCMTNDIIEFIDENVRLETRAGACT